ncbi:MAG: hypothetical protein IT322_05160, partial [Anaerolineae bacterium]|nr:hypothetical protein [Anaerolineae bacterium]
MTTIANMTLDELKKFVEETLDERLTRLLGTFEIPDESDEDDGLTWDEVRASVERHRWTPPPGAKTSLELLRE